MNRVLFASIILALYAIVGFIEQHEPRADFETHVMECNGHVYEVDIPAGIADKDAYCERHCNAFPEPPTK